MDKEFHKMRRREGYNLEIIFNKLQEICSDPYKFKPLNAPMKNFRRVHVLKSFVIIYSIDESAHTVWIEDYDHHDNVYQG